jgi:enoyl-CoA hydratase/carnithine racemase
VSDRPPVRIERRGTLGLVTMDRPEQRNPLDPASAAALLAAFRELFDDDAVRSVAVTGAGDAFCAGGDLRQMGRFRTLAVDEAMAWPTAIIELHKLMLDAPKPVVAAVDGAAYAGGMGLAGMCDIVLATRRSRFAMPEVRLGLFPMIIVTHLVRTMPRKVLLEMMLTGEPIEAEEGHRVGLVNRVYDDREAMFKGLDGYAETFARTSPQAQRLGRKALALLAELPPGQALDAAYFLNLPFFLGDDLAEGAEAFLDRRPPHWHPEAPA